MNHRKSFWRSSVTWVALSALLLTAGCSGTSTPAAPSTGTAPAGAKQVVKLAAIQSLTGQDASYGGQALEGIQLAVEVLNKAGGIEVKGEKVQIQIEVADTASDKAQVANLMQKYAGNKEILAALGPTSSRDFLTALPIAGQLKFPIIATGSGAPLTQEKWNPWAFRDSLVADIATPAFFEVAAKKFGIKSVANIYQIDHDYQVADSKIFQNTWKKLGLTIAGVEGFRGGDTDFSAQLTKLMNNKPDALFVSAPVEWMAPIMIQSRSMGFKGRFLGTLSFNEPKLFEMTKGAAAGALTYQAFNPANPRPEAKAFLEQYKAKHSKEPGPFVVYGYDAVLIYVDAIKRSGTLTDRQAFRDALGSTKSVEAVNGSYTYNNPPTGDTTVPLFTIIEFDSTGKMVPVK